MIKIKMLHDFLYEYIVFILQSYDKKVEYGRMK